MEGKKERKNAKSREKEIRHIIDVPKSFVEYCLKNANSEKKKSELKKILKQFG